MAFTSGTPNLTGTVDSDIIYVDVSGPGTIDGGDGDDLIIDNYGNILTLHGTSFGAAYDLDFDNSFWYDNSVRENPLVFDDAVPHLTALVTPGAATQVYYRISVGAGETLTVDIDAAGGALGTADAGTDTRVYLFLQGDLVNEVAENDDSSLFNDGGYGSASNLDSFVSYTNATAAAQTIFIRIEEFFDSDSNFEAGDDFMVHFSLTGHTVGGVSAGTDGTTINGDARNDHLFGAGGDDTLNGGANNDTLVGGSGEDTLNGGIGSDALDGGTGIDTLNGGTGNDTLNGGSGDDILNGDADDDILIGGAGADVLDGGAGADRLQFDLTGDLAAGEVINGGADNDKIEILGEDGDIFDFRGTDIQNMEEIEFGSTGTAGTRTIRLDGGDVQSGLAANLLIDGWGVSSYIETIEIYMDTAGSITLSGWTFETFGSVSGLAGETISIFGTVGADIIRGSSENDIIEAGDSTDEIFTSGGQDVLRGGAGNDIIHAFSNQLVAGDVIDGGADADIIFLAAGGGGDAFDFRGTDIQNIEQIYFFLPSMGDNIVQFDGGDVQSGLASNLSVEGEGSGLDYIEKIEIYMDASGTIDISGWTFIEFGSTATTSVNGMETISIFGTFAVDIIIGSSENDIIEGGSGGDTLSGGAGDDDLFGGLGIDTLNGGADNDMLSGGSGGDTLNGDAGDDDLSGGFGIDTLNGGADNDMLSGGSGNDALDGGEGDDVLSGGFGNDALDGGAGTNDTLSYVDLQGNVFADLTSGTAQVDVTRITAANVTTNSAFAQSALDGDAYINIETTAQMGGEIRGQFTLISNTIVGDITTIILTAVLDGSQVVPAVATDATGIATLTLIFNSVTSDWTYSIETTIDGIGAANVTGADLYVGAAGVSGAQDSDILAAAGATVEALIETDTLSNIENISGGVGDDNLIGDGNVNVLIGGDGADTLDGGAGADTLDGGAGDDTFLFTTTGDIEAGDTLDGGADTDAILLSNIGGGVFDFRGASLSSIEILNLDITDSVAGGTVIQLTADQVTNDLAAALAIDGSGQPLQIQTEQIEIYASQSGTVDLSGWTFTDFGPTVLFFGVYDVSVFGAFGADTITGTSISDRLIGGAGDDILNGGDSIDTLIGGFGNDTLDGGSGGTDFDTASFAGDIRNITADLSAGSPVATASSTVIEASNVSASNTVLSEALLGNIYINVHTTSYGGGEIRGQLSETNVTSDITDGAGVRTVVFDAISLTGAQEVPPVTTTAEGLATVVFTVNNGTVTYSIVNHMINLAPGNITASHLHLGVAGANSGVISDILGVGATIMAVTETDTLIDIENLVGGSGDDVLTGDAGSNFFRGGLGLDSLSGGAGNDGFIFDTPSELVAGEFLDGGTGADPVFNQDRLIIVGTDGDVFDFRDVTIFDVEVAVFDIIQEGAQRTIQIDAADLVTGRLDAAHLSVFVPGDISFIIFGFDNGVSNLDLVEVHMDTAGTLDISDWYFQSFGSTALIDVMGQETVSLFGTAGVDTLIGSSQNDILIGGAGGDSLTGGAGDDVVSYEGSAARVIANLFTGTGAGVGSDASGDTYTDIEGVIGSSLNDILVGRDGASDTLRGGEGNDSLRANGADDFVFGEGGNDLIFAGFGNDTIDGGDGIDTLMLTNASAGSIIRLDLGTGSLNVAQGDTYTNIENVAGSAFRDLLYGDDGNNFLDGRGGNDLLIGNGGADVLDGGDGFDTVSYSNSGSAVSVSLFLGSGPGNDIIRNVEHLVGSNFNDLLVGNDGADETLDGGGGADSLRGNGGNDTLNGGDGNDILFSGFGNDAHDGGAGFDTITYAQASAGVIVRLDLGTGSLGHAAGDTYANIENITGSSAFRDLLYGNEIGNVIDGRGGNDLLIGNGGSDTLIGGNGFDKLDGGTGFDVLTGGAGDDIFVFEAGYQADRITDFIIGDDKVDLTSFGYTMYSQVSSLMYTSGADTVLTFGGGDAIRLVGISLGDLSASDFIITAPPGNAPAEKGDFANEIDSFDFGDDVATQNSSMAFMQQELMAEFAETQAMNVPFHKSNDFNPLEASYEDDFSYDFSEWII